MSTEKLDMSLAQDLETLKKEGRAKPPERIIEHYIPAKGKSGPRYKMVGNDGEFIRLNSNSYLSLSNHPKLTAAADKATDEFGVGPGALRFIDGTFIHHDRLKKAGPVRGKTVSQNFNSAYTAQSRACTFDFQ